MSELLVEIVLVPIDMLLCLTGEAVLWMMTFGHHRPRWDLYTSERPAKFVLFSETSRWVGLGFWLVVAVLTHRCLYGGSA